MTTGSVHAGASADGPRPPQAHGLAGPGSAGEVPGVHESPDQEEVDVLYLAGQQAPAAGAWLLATAVDGKPGGQFAGHVLPETAATAFGGDVVVQLDPDNPAAGQPPPAVRAAVFAVLGGRLIPAGAWPRCDLDEWPERVRPAVAFAMGVLTKLEEHDADLGARDRVDLAAAPRPATAGIPLHLTFPAGKAAPIVPWSRQPSQGRRVHPPPRFACARRPCPHMGLPRLRPGDRVSGSAQAEPPARWPIAAACDQAARLSPAAAVLLAD